MLSRYFSRLECTVKHFVITYNNKYFNKDLDIFIPNPNEASTFSTYKEVYEYLKLKNFKSSKIQEIKLEDAKIPFSLFLENMVNSKAGRVILLITNNGIPSCILKDKEANIIILNHCNTVSGLFKSVQSSSKTTYIIIPKYDSNSSLSLHSDIVIQATEHLTYEVLKNRGTGVIKVSLVDDSL